MTAVRRLADRYVDELAVTDPWSATLLGLPGYDGRVPDLTPEGAAARAEVRRGLLRRLAAVADEEPGDALSRAVLEERVAADVALHDTGERLAPCDVVAGPVQQLREVVALVDLADDDAWRDLAARLHGVPTALAGWRRSLVLAAETGPPPQRRQVLRTAEHSDLLQASLAALPERYGDGPLRRDLDRAVARAGDALTTTATALREEVAAVATPTDGVGPDRYRRWVRYFLGTDLDLAATYAWGWSEVQRLRAELDTALAELRPDTPHAQVRAELDADPRYAVAGADRLRAWLQDRADATTSRLDGTVVDVPPPLRRIRVEVDASGTGGTHYTSPSPDLRRPGTVWWAVAPEHEVFPTWRAATTLVHEGVPGHHLHLGSRVVQGDALDRFRRLACYAPGTTEGWALYAERLVAELGHLDDPAERLGLLESQLWRAGRVVVDIGLHLGLPLPDDVPGDLSGGLGGGGRWTAERADAFLRDACHLDGPRLRTYEVERYLGRPGQALAYAVGEREVLAAREEAARAAGDDFDLRRWHASVLALGPMGLDTLRDALRR